jgi:hypothetical protein
LLFYYGQYHNGCVNNKKENKMSLKKSLYLSIAACTMLVNIYGAEESNASAATAATTEEKLCRECEKVDLKDDEAVLNTADATHQTAMKKAAATADERVANEAAATAADAQPRTGFTDSESDSESDDDEQTPAPTGMGERAAITDGDEEEAE